MGPTSLASLIHNMDELMHDFTHASGMAESTTTAVRQKIEKLSSTADMSNLVNDASMLKMPPTLIVEALIDPYFDTIACYVPIWTSASFRKLLAASKDEDDFLDSRAFTLCSNNLVLLTLTARTLNSRANNPSNGSIDLELVQSYVANANRAIANIEQLTRPRLINIQALLSLVGSFTSSRGIHQILLLTIVFSV
jgi:hypothetical protein